MNAIPLPPPRLGVAATSCTKSLQVPKPTEVAVAGLLMRNMAPVFLKPIQRLPSGASAAPLGRPIGSAGDVPVVLSFPKGQPVVPPVKRLPVILPAMAKMLLKSSAPCPPSPEGRNPRRKIPSEFVCSSTRYRLLVLGSNAIGPPVTERPFSLKGQVSMLTAKAAAVGFSASAARPLSISGSTRQRPKLVSPIQRCRTGCPEIGLIALP